MSIDAPNLAALLRRGATLQAEFVRLRTDAMAEDILGLPAGDRAPYLQFLGLRGRYGPGPAIVPTAPPAPPAPPAPR